MLVVACLAGAGGLGLEVLLTNLAGLTIGYGLAAPVGIGAYILGWSLGARLAGTRPDLEGRLWGVAIGALLLAGALGPQLLAMTAASGSGPALQWLVTVAVLFAAALPQGTLFPMLSRHWPLGSRGDLAALMGANLLGASLGAKLFAELLPALQGRALASLAAGLGATLAAAAGLWLWKTRGKESVQREEAPSTSTFVLHPVAAGVVLATMTGWVASLEWFGVRLGLLWFGGMQSTLGNVLVASLLSLSLGAAVLPKLLPRGRSAIWMLGLACVASSQLLFFLPALLEGSEERGSLWRAILLVGPALLPFGAWVPVLHRMLAGDSAQRLGKLLGWEALGVLLGLLLSHLVLMPHLGMGGALVLWSALGLAACLACRPRFAPLLAGAATLAGVVVVLLLKPASPALDSPPLANPQLELLEFKEDEHFAVCVVQDGLLGERTLLTDGFRAAASGRDYAYMRALGHLPLLLHPEPARVGVLAFGTGTTAGAVSLHEDVRSIEVLELSNSVTDYADRFEEVNRGVLSDERVTLTLGDGRHSLARRAGAYDVLTMEPLLPDSPFGVYLYTEEFYERARTSLAEGGLLCQWVPPHALEPAVFEAVLGAFTSAFDWSSVWLFGTQVILLGSDRAPLPGAARFPEEAGELQRQLASLGLDQLEGVLARYVLDGSALPASTRPLTDLDPWVIYRPRRPGREAITDLPKNLARLREWSTQLPVEWWMDLSPEAESRLQAVRFVRRAREAFEVERAASLGVELSGLGLASDSESALVEASRLAPNEPALIRLEAEKEFFLSLQQAKLLLASSASEENAAAAAALLARAGALRPERADVHAYLSLAFERLGSDRAEAAMQHATELCPRLLETRVGEQLRLWRGR